MAKGYIKNRAIALAGCDAMIQRLNDTPIEKYRKIVRDIFRRVLNHTPQYTGKAVASWTIGIGARAPEPAGLTGLDATKLARRLASGKAPHQRGSEYWARVAREREEPKLQKLRIEDKVYITNHALGEGGQLYMDLYQNPEFWIKHLREVNKPYEVVGESIEYVAARYKDSKVYPFRAYVPEYGGVP